MRFDAMIGSETNGISFYAITLLKQDGDPTTKVSDAFQ